MKNLLYPVFLSAVLLFAGSAFSQTEENFLEPVKDPVPEEDKTFFEEEGGSMILALGDPTYTNIKVPCKVYYDECTADYRINLGNMTGEYTPSGRTSLSIAYMTTNYCGSGADTGSVPTNKNLILFVANAWGHDTSNEDGGRVYFGLTVWEYTGGGCTGTNTRTGYDTTGYCTFGITNGGSQLAWAETAANCAGVYGDPATCHLPDVAMTAPQSTGIWYYKYKLSTQVCDPNGGRCTTSDAYGCFNVGWYNP
ncbi:MAG: hypothetical protein FJ088_09055 [Deltaproteobacteria bacterium]|nr:hypothetical protein [Deltaproteobacteria bacterium]